MARSYTSGNTFEELTETFRLNPSDADRVFSGLLKEGYSRSGICYAVSRAEEKILRFAGEDRIYGIIVNEVHKYALKSGDPKWDTKKKK